MEEDESWLESSNAL